MLHLVRGNRVRNGRDGWAETRKICLPKVALSKIPVDSVQYNTEHYGMHDDKCDEHSALGVEEAARRSQSHLY